MSSPFPPPGKKGGDQCSFKNHGSHKMFIQFPRYCSLAFVFTCSSYVCVAVPISAQGCLRIMTFCKAKKVSNVSNYVCLKSLNIL